ncbi:MAG: hypothetical protein ACRDA5_09955, partial [Clostridium sp.]
QKLLRLGDFSIEDVNEVNKSVNSIVDSISLLEVVLAKKISIVQNGCTLNNCTNSKEINKI